MFRTGDLGVRMNDRIYFRGRKDSVVKVRGQKVSLEVIEQKLREIEGLTRVVAVCAPNADGLNSVRLIITLRSLMNVLYQC
jgi:acyl-coenzyme A synthetase/AMP-(fatty) acid ligase